MVAQGGKEPLKAASYVTEDASLFRVLMDTIKGRDFVKYKI